MPASLEGSLFYVLRCRSTHTVLDNHGGQRGTDSIRACSSDGRDPHHQWQFVPAGAEWYNIVNRASGQVMDSGGS
eukprot:1418566-Amphidinium_carterae.2